MTTVSISRGPSTADNPVETVAFVRLKGEVDLTIEPALAKAVDQLRALTPGMVVVDLSGITFAGSILVGFLARIHRAVPPSTHIMAHGAIAIVRRLLEITGTGQYVTLHDSDAPETAAT